MKIFKLISSETIYLNPGIEEKGNRCRSIMYITYIDFMIKMISTRTMAIFSIISFSFYFFQPYTASLPLDIPVFAGTHADLLIIVFHRLMIMILMILTLVMMMMMTLSMLTFSSLSFIGSSRPATQGCRFKPS